MEYRIHNVILSDDSELYIRGEAFRVVVNGTGEHGADEFETGGPGARADSDSSGLMVTGRNNLEIRAGGMISSDTYFGALSVGKWKKYTDIDRIGLVISARGEFELDIYHVVSVGSNVYTDRISRYTVRHKSVEEFKADIPVLEEGLVYFTINRVSVRTCIYDAYYSAESDHAHNVKLAINICTYRRFDYLSRNIKRIREELMSRDDNAECSSSGGCGFAGYDLEVFITDNASEIPVDTFDDERIHLYHNRNLGGAGGFARGLYEIIKPGRGFTHVLFMDDDATVEPESIRRTYMLLSLLKEEYAGAFISGAMLRSEEPCVQHENGALWNDGRCKFIGRGSGLYSLHNITQNESDHHRDYAAWWYCCIPITEDMRDNMPIPVFIHEDDAEYSLRKADGIITMNAICVWHPAQPHRRMSVNEYYNLRNMLIVNSRYCPEYGAGMATKKVVTSLAAALMRHRYRDMKLIRKAVRDYLAGPEYLMGLDPVKLHRTVTDMGYRFDDISEVIEDVGTRMCAGENIKISSQEIHENGEMKESVKTDDSIQRGFRSIWSESDSLLEKLALIGRLVSLNGWLLPRKKYTEAHFMNEHPVNLFRAGRLVLFDDADNKGIVADKEFFRLFEMMGYAIEAWIRLMLGYRRAAGKFNSCWSEMTSWEYWKDQFERTETVCK